jgi:hypothetical protein
VVFFYVNLSEIYKNDNIRYLYSKLIHQYNGSKIRSTKTTNTNRC